MSTPAKTSPQPVPGAPPATPAAVRLGAVAVVAAIVGVVVGGGAAYFLVRHFENSSPGQVVIRNVTVPGGSGTVSVPSLLTQLGPSLVEVIREPAPGTPITNVDLSSGFVATAAGLVVTNEGAVAGASGVEVVLASGQLLSATIAAADPDTGVVVLQVSSSTLPAPLTFATSPPAPGDVAIAVSLPVGGPSVDVGSVSSVGLTVTVPDLATATGQAVIDGVLRTDTPQPVGSTGGPLVDSSGEVIGILTGDRMQPVDQGASAASSGFALDASAADQLISSLNATGSGPHPIGFVSKWMDPTSAAALGFPAGVLAISVDPGSAAAQAGVQAGDVVTAVDGRAAWSAKTTVYPSFSDYLVSLGSGAQVPITVYRTGVSRQLSLTLPSP
ncbi:MAG TPA: S1C family serine protease [Candidatus Dormibacteraeota bacterium]|nr:S1C family serine protease [Candidatus Dormibacteraeota bacterium]